MTITQRMRPLRLAFLVAPDDPGHLMRAIELSAARWGGAANVIIPVARRRTQWMFRDRRPDRTATEVVGGYIDTFEPDFVVPTDAALADVLDLPTNLLASPEAIEVFGPGPGLASGVDVSRVYERLWQRELRFAPMDAPSAVLPVKEDEEGGLLAATLLGALSPRPHLPLLDDLLDSFSRIFDPDDTRVDTDLLSGLILEPGLLGPIQATLCETHDASRVRPPLTFFVFDPGRPLDLVDLWNLRAAGFGSHAVPAPWVDALAPSCARCLEETLNFEGLPRRGGPPAVFASRTLGLEPARQLALAIAREGDEGQEPIPIAAYPPLWDDVWLRSRNFVRRELVCEETQADVSVADDGYVQFECRRPAWLRGRVWPSPSWASVVNVRELSLDSELGEVIPPRLRTVPGIAGIERAHGLITTTRSGLAVRCDDVSRHQAWRLPTGTELCQEYLALQGLDTVVSPAGQTTLQLLRAVGGPLGARLFQDLDLIKLLNRAAEGLIEETDPPERQRPSRGRVIPIDQLVATLRRAHDDPVAAAGHAAALARAGVIAPVVRIRCPLCSQLNWFEPEELATRLRCERCREPFGFPATDPPARSDWGYRPQGAFSASGFAMGGYAVALALRFFVLGFEASARTWSVSLRSLGTTAFETDFLVWVREGIFGESPPRLVFGEAKTFGRFNDRDLARARDLLGAFPEASVTLVTLREELEQRERRAVRRLATVRRAGGAHPNRSRLIVLTAHELAGLTPMSPLSSWQQLGGRHAQIAERHPYADSQLSILSDASLELYCEHCW